MKPYGDKRAGLFGCSRKREFRKLPKAYRFEWALDVPSKSRDRRPVVANDVGCNDCGATGYDCERKEGYICECYIRNYDSEEDDGYYDSSWEWIHTCEACREGFVHQPLQRHRPSREPTLTVPLAVFLKKVA